ncbi:MAG: cobyrinate a,c-diamide synthase [Desulfobacteraceae bacterium]
MEGTITRVLVIAGTQSGAGKTTLALGLMAALRRRGLSVAPFKVGPDFIDPGHHARVAGRSSRNLDGWMLDRAYNQAAFRQHANGCDVAVVEGVMGLFDGFSGNSEAGSTAQMAKWLGLPVLLVVNAASMARSAAALVQGFERFDPQVRFAGAVFNNLGSPGHLTYLQEAMAAYVEMPLLGGMLRNDALRMPERHLGLTTVEDHPLTSGQIGRLADHIESGINLDELLAQLPTLPGTEKKQLDRDASARSIARVGIARDRAFCFYYPDNLELLEAAGLELVPFSPLEDERPPHDLDGLYLGGGYPELHARQLADNRQMRESILQFSNLGMPIYAECGGFMYLCRELKETDGEIFPMCQCFPFRSRMHATLRTLGYREVRLCADTLLGNKGRILRGHEFHYSDLEAGTQSMPVVETVYSAGSRSGRRRQADGYRVNRTLGSYIHLHFGSFPECALNFARACRDYRHSRRTGHETP